MVLDIQPPRVARRNLPEYLLELSGIDSGLDSDPPNHVSLVEHLVRREGAVGSDLKSLVMLTGLQESALLQILENLKSVLLVPTDPPLAVSRESIAALCDSIRGHLKDYHSSKPLAVGVPREEIKKRFLPGSSGIYFQFLLEIWAAERVLSIQGKHIALYGSEIRLNPVQEEIRAKVLRTISGSALNAPTLAEIASQVSHPIEEVREVFYYLLEAGEILKVSGEMVLAPMHLDRLKERLHRAFPPGTLFTVPEFKEIFSLSRKYAIPLLEMLDREKVTRRVGDGRMVV
jgi:selenocysteine-specific elongation factor